MPNMDLPLVYRYRPGQSEAPIVLMVHGYGSHENDLFGLADFLPSHLHLLSVRAPIPLDTVLP
jgi:Predicted esterase